MAKFNVSSNLARCSFKNHFIGGNIIIIVLEDIVFINESDFQRKMIEDEIGLLHRKITIGFPTANLAPIDRTFLPADGVYVADVVIDGKRYRSMTSLGKNVTFGGTELRLEANIFDFEGDIYGKTIEVFWLDYIRDMIKFNNIDELCAQLEADKKIAEKF